MVLSPCKVVNLQPGTCNAIVACSDCPQCIIDFNNCNHGFEPKTEYDPTTGCTPCICKENFENFMDRGNL